MTLQDLRPELLAWLRDHMPGVPAAPRTKLLHVHQFVAEQLHGVGLEGGQQLLILGAQGDGAPQREPVAACPRVAEGEGDPRRREAQAYERAADLRQMWEATWS